MTSKLICPFCGEEIKIAGERTTIMSCFNGECCGSGLYGEEAMWQALTQAKQDLEQSEKCCSAWETQALDYKAETIALSGKLEIARKALEEIDWCAQDYAKAQESLNEIKQLIKGE